MIKKFRIWDGYKFLFTDRMSLQNDSGGWPYLRINLNHHFNTKSKYGFTIQQWTGLTDSQGVEIYEGDIITFRPKSNKPPFWQVIFDYGLAIYCLFNRKKEIYFKYEDNTIGHICGPDVRVIGNIFQNPELLEKC